MGVFLFDADGNLVSEGRISSFKSWREVYVLRDDSSVQEGEHSIGNVVFTDWWWISKGVISEVFR